MSAPLQHWLTASQKQLLQAILTDGEQAIAAWRQWQAQTDLETLDSGSFFLLSQLYLKLSQLQVSDPSLAKLRGIYRQTWLKNQIAMRSIAMLLELFAKANIPVLIMKGAPLLLPVRDCLTYLKQEFGEFGAEIPEDFIHHLQNFQTSPKEQRRYFELVRENRTHRSFLEKLRCHWWRYCNTKGLADSPGRLFRFIPYYLSYKQWEWQLAHPWQVPGKVLSKEIKRLTGRM